MKRQLSINAFHAGTLIALDEIKSFFNIEPIREEKKFLLYKEENGKYIYFKDYGSAVFIGYNKKELRSIYKDIFNRFPFKQQHTEHYKIALSPLQNKVKFNEIIVNQITDDIAHVIMLNLGQSVALDYYQSRTNDLLMSTRLISKELEENGKVTMSSTKLNKYIGRTMVLKNRISENLYIFESSDLAWSDEELSYFDKRLSQELEFVERYQGLQSGLTVVKENLDLFRGLLDHKHSTTLEWIIIILIAIEILQILV